MKKHKHEKEHKKDGGSTEVLHANKKELEEEKVHKNGGGSVMKKMAKAEGHKSKHRADKKARGGAAMTPGSPMSGADSSTKVRPGFSKGSQDKEND